MSENRKQLLEKEVKTFSGGVPMARSLSLRKSRSRPVCAEQQSGWRTGHNPLNATRRIRSSTRRNRKSPVEEISKAGLTNCRRRPPGWKEIGDWESFASREVISDSNGLAGTGLGETATGGGSGGATVWARALGRIGPEIELIRKIRRIRRIRIFPMDSINAGMSTLPVISDCRKGQRTVTPTSIHRRLACLRFILRIARERSVPDRAEIQLTIHQRKKRTNAEHKIDAGMVGETAQGRRTDAAHAKGEAKKEPGNRSYFSGNQFLSVDQYGGKSGGARIKPIKTVMTAVQNKSV